MTPFLEGLRRRSATAAFLGSLSLPAAAQCGVDWQAGPPAPGPNDAVTCLTRMPNGDLIAGGLFERADAAVARHIARWDGAVWRALGSGLDDRVRAVAVLPNGDLLAGGRFLNAGTTPASRLARWDGTSWSEFGGGAGGEVLAIHVLPNGDILVGGFFASIGGAAAAAIARWNGSSWSALGNGLPGASGGGLGTVASIVSLPNGDVIAAGQFALGGVLPLLALARWDGATWSPLVNATGGNVTGVGRELALLPNGDVVAIGSFNSGPFSGGSELLRWNGTVATPVVTPVLSPFALAVAASGQVAVGGLVIPALQPPRPGVALWDGTTWTPLPAVPAGNVDALQFEPNGSLVSGQSLTASSPVSPVVRRWNGSSWTPLGAPVPPVVRTMHRAADGGMFIGGSFASFGGTAANNVAYWRNGIWSPLGLGVDGLVESMTLAPNGDLIVSGEFTTAGGAPANRIARWNGFAWSTLGAGLNAAADNLAATVNGEVYAAPGATLFRFDGAQWTQVILPLGGSTRALAALPDGSLLLGGRMGGFFPQQIEQAVWRYAAGAVTPLTSNLLNAYDVLVTRSGRIVAIGTNEVVAWDSATSTAVSLGGAPAGSTPQWLAELPNGDLLAGGFFESLGGVATPNLARFDGTTWRSFATTPLDFGSQTGAVADDGTLFVAGGFTAAGDLVTYGFATATPGCPASAIPVGAGCAGAAGPMALQPGDRPWAGGVTTSTATGFPTLALGIHVVGVQSVVAPLPGGSAGCSLLVTPLLTELLVPVAGRATTAIAIPANVSLAGAFLRTQVVGLELDATLGLVRITSTNALDLVIGAF
jgi:trimeric autotransporter adhesin